MEDKRIRKTKHDLKQALVRLLAHKPFEQITVTELCSEAETSRVTFYTHYNDKFGVAEEIFADVNRLATAEYRRLQETNNPQRDPVVSYCNLLDSILDLCETHGDLFAYADPEESPFLYFLLYKYMIRQVSDHVERERAGTRLRYPIAQVTSFLCNGLWGYVNQCHAGHCPPAQIRQNAKALLRDILQSGIFAPLPGGEG